MLLPSQGRGGQRPTVVVDANIIIASPRLSSGAWRAALYARDQGALSIRVPEVAILEVVAWVDREMPVRLDKFRRAASLLDQLGLRFGEQSTLGHSLGCLESEARGIVAEMEHYLRTRLGPEAILTIPPIAHRDLVSRAVRRAKPFSASGSGYRDALIWEDVCALAAEGDVVFVSENSKDFADQDGGLAQELRDDLVRRGLAASRVTLTASLRDVVAEFAPEATDARAVVEQILGRAGARQQLQGEFDEAFATYEGIPLRAGTDLHPLMYDAAVDAVWDLQAVRVDSIKAIGDATYLVLGSAQATVRAYSRRERVDLTDVESARAAIIDGRITDAFQESEDLVLIKHLQALVKFEANVDPGDLIWNAGVVDVLATELDNSQ